MKVTEKAFAKINLFLDVTAKRSDGFHELCSVMQSVSLADEITLSATRADYTCITLSCDDESLPLDERNLAYVAAERFLEKTGITARVDIYIEKHIPVSAGLAGGSTDAAAVLRALNLIFDESLTTEALLCLGAEIGSDVPFCILGGTCLCRGRGETMEPYSVPDAYFVICKPNGEGMQTPKAYALLDDAFDHFKEDASALHDALLSFFREDPYYGMYNVFESVVLPQCACAAEIRSELIALGARGALMSGSGTAVFGVFDTEDEAVEASREMPGGVVCRSVGPIL